MADIIRVGGASGYWGDASLATPQLLADGNVDYLVYDYLAEITMSILARARAADDSKGYAVDFVSAAMAPNLERIAASGVRVIANAGGVNPEACAQALREVIAGAGLALRVGVVTGDDLLARADSFDGCREMFSGDAFPDPERVASINAYLGAFPIAALLEAGADIVITGRCVDSAVTLAACLHAFGWGPDDLDRLAQGSLAGHLLECGTQATGGNFTDWEQVVESLPEAGYPIAEIEAGGEFTITKPAGTGGAVSVGTVAEQMLYEIGDPQAYVLPDVICDFSAVRLAEEGEDRVRVAGARGRGVPDSFKVCATWSDGFRAGQIWTMVGRNAAHKAECFARGVFARTGRALALRGLAPPAETLCEIIGAGSQTGTAVPDAEEVDLKLALKHESAQGVGLFLKEMTGLALTAPPGLTAFAGARAKPSPVVRLFSFLLPKSSVPVAAQCDGNSVELTDAQAVPAAAAAPLRPPAPPESGEPLVACLLEHLAWARSGDKGDKANIGVIARRPDYLPWIADALTPDRVAAAFDHFLAPGQAHPVERFYLPGSNALNFLLHDVLGGGGIASLRSDPQGKAYAQTLLALPVPVPESMARAAAAADPRRQVA